MSEPNTLVLFDFDGTLTDRDSLFDFLSFSHSPVVYLINLLLSTPYLVAFKLGFITNQTAKEKLLSCFFRGKKLEKIQELGEQYCSQRLPDTLRPAGLEKLNWHITEGHRVILVSASLEVWLKPWCETLGIELLATRISLSDQVFTGHFLGNNCHGKEKVERIKEHLKLDDYSNIYAYGDSSGDTEMLALTKQSFYKPFR